MDDGVVIVIPHLAHQIGRIIAKLSNYWIALGVLRRG